MPNGKRIIRVVRGRKATVGVCLAKRRKWYSEDSNKTANGQTEDETSQGSTSSDVQGDIDENERIAVLERQNAELKQEAARRRLAAKEAENALEIERHKRLEEQGEWRKLAEERLTEIERLQPIEQRHTAFVEGLREENEARLQQIPDHNRDLVPVEDMSPERLSQYLTANWPRLTSSPVPSTDAGAGGGSSGRRKRKTTEYDQAAAGLAARYGYQVDPEAIARRREALQQTEENE